MIVVDASVAVKWLIPEAGSEQAIELLKGDVLATPDLIRIEVASAVTRRARVGEMEAAEAESLRESWLTWLGRGALTLFPTDPDLPDAVRFALAIRHPLADCLYLALAARWQTELLTADRRFFERARGAYPVRLWSIDSRFEQKIDPMVGIGLGQGFPSVTSYSERAGS